ncbi:hypothetical protein QLL95_gp0105 [Cotonvirus japonicus]|uniref:Nucleotidyltransferase n=1 Tax=Cotonvirus japonicus TaxID=2811091 RepID=A0ABM7NR24_9VIRU|nr:hypothetical protein QLL95_gp0105 [Cotonvirus japonicus]BCS82594.1 hypothetical protein [Cotonvirus japonicus]
MDYLETIFPIIFQNNGMLAGSFVRDCIIREEPVDKNRDIDILVPFKNSLGLQKDLVNKFKAKIITNDYNEDDHISHYLALIDGYEFDIFSGDKHFHCYLSPPDVDVNTLIWDCHGLMTWYDLNENKIHGYQMEIDDIVQRCLKKQAVVVRDEWIDDINHLEQRLNKLIKKNWTILN